MSAFLEPRRDLENGKGNAVPKKTVCGARGRLAAKEGHALKARPRISLGDYRVFDCFVRISLVQYVNSGFFRLRFSYFHR